MAHAQEAEPLADIGRLHLESPFAALTRARESQALTIDDVSQRLLLSRQQVRSLEAGETRPFHNETFYRRALDSYEALLGLRGPAPPTRIDAPSPVSSEPLRLTLVDGAPRPGGTRRRPLRLAAIALVAALVGWGAFLIWTMTGAGPGAP